jgi:hypothetical protein
MSSFKKSVDNIYYNVRINGNNDGSYAVANYSEQRTIPLIDNPSDYYFSCIRFNIPTSTIPLLIVPVLPYPNVDQTKTVFSVSLSYNGFSSGQTNIVWAPVVGYNESSSLTPLKPLSSSNPNTDANDTYYYCTSYMYFMGLVNKAFKSAFTTLGGLTALPVGAVAPYYTYNGATKLFTLVAQSAFYDVNIVGTPIQIFMNNDLWNLFGAVSGKYNVNPTIVGNDRQVLIAGDVANVDASGNIQFQQEYISICQWMAMKSVLITTNTIPIVSEGIPSVSNNYAPNNGSNGQSTYLPIISSYDALVTTAGFEDFQSTIQFAVSGPYKLIDMIGNNPLSSFDIQIYWQDIYGTLHPLYIAPYESATFTFLLMKKGTQQKIN